MNGINQRMILFKNNDAHRKKCVMGGFSLRPKKKKKEKQKETQENKNKSKNKSSNEGFHYPRNKSHYF